MATFIHDSFGEINQVAKEGDEVVIASGAKSGIYRYFDLSTFPSFSYRFLGSKQLDLGTPFENFDSTNDSITIDFWTNRGANDDGRAFAAVLPWTDSFMDFSLDSHTITNFGAIDAKLFPAYDSGNSSITLESDWNIMQVDSALDSLNLFSPFTIEYLYNKFNTKNNRIFSINQRFDTLLSLDETGIVYNGTKYNLHEDSNLLSDSWTHNVLSYDGFEPRIYRDGNLLTSLTRQDSTHFPVGVVDPSKDIDRKVSASFSIKTTIPESDKTLFFCGVETNRLVVRTINLGTQIEFSAGRSKQLSLTANVPDNINPHVISWDVNPRPGKIRLWIDSNYQGEASITTSLDNDEWAGTAFLPPDLTSFTESKTMITGGITGSTEIATKDRTDGAQFYNQGPAFMDKPAFHKLPDGSYRYIICYPSVVGPMPVGQANTILAGGYSSSDYGNYPAANMSYHRSNDDLGGGAGFSKYGFPYFPRYTENAFKEPSWVAGHVVGNGSAYGSRKETSDGSVFQRSNPTGTKFKGSTSGSWWKNLYWPDFVKNPATGVNFTENDRINMGLFKNGATEHHGFGHQGYRWRLVPPGSTNNENSFWFKTWSVQYRTKYSKVSTPVLASYVKINSMTITPGGKNNYYFEVGEREPGNWYDRYFSETRNYKYYLVKESLIDDTSVFYENRMPSGPRPGGSWVYPSTTGGNYGTYPFSEPHGDGIYSEAVDDIDISKYYTSGIYGKTQNHEEFIISEQDSHVHMFTNGVWKASYPFPSGDGPYKFIISSRGTNAQEAAGQYSAWRMRTIWNSDHEHGSMGNTYNANMKRIREFENEGLGTGAGGHSHDYTYNQAVLKFSQKSWRWDPEVAYKNVPDAHRGGVTAATEYTTGVTTYGTPGSAGAYTEITVAAGEPILNYYCGNHSGMGGATDHSAATATTYVVTVASTSDGNKYFLNGVQQALISLAPGATYTFDQSDTSNATHILKFSTTANGTHAGSVATSKIGSVGIDSDGSTWTGTLSSNLLYNKQLFVNYSDAELFVGNNIKSVKGLPHETGTQHAIDYVANTGGTIYNWSNPDGSGLSLQQQMSQINDGDAIVIAPGTYTVINDHGTANMSGVLGFHQRKNILITGSTNDPTDVILDVAYFGELFSGRNAADGASPSGALKELAYLTFKHSPWALIYAPTYSVSGRAYRVNFEFRSNSYHVYASRRTSDIRFEECLISNTSTPRNSIWSKYDARCFKWINCIFEKTGGQDPALQTDPRQANVFIGTNIMQVGDDIKPSKSKFRLGIPYFKVDTENPNTPVNKKRYIEDFMIHKTDKYDSISVTTTLITTVVGGNPSNHPYHNVGSSNKYAIDGSTATSDVTLLLTEGSTYRFDQSASSNSGHPLRFSSTPNGTHDGGSEYTTGVTTSGTPGNAGAYTQIVVASGAPTLYYYCTNHSSMGWKANTPASGLFPINRQPFTDSNTKLHIASNMTGGEQLAYNIDGTLIINNKSIKLNNASNDLGDWHHHSFNYRGSDNVLFSYFDGNKIDSMNIELDIEELSKSNLLLASTDDYDITSHSIVKSFSNLYIKEMRVSRKMRESGDVFTLPDADLTTDSYTVILDATVSGNPLSIDVSPYTADAKAYRKVHSFNPGIESAAFEPLVTIGSGTNAPAKNEEPLNFTLRDGYRPVPHYVFKYESDGLLSNPTGYTSIVESDGSYIGELTGFIHDSLVTPDSDLAFDRSSHIIKLKRFDDLGDSINWSYTKSIPRNNIQLGRYDDDSNSIFYVKAYDISESNLHWNTDLNFVGKHIDSATRTPHIESGTRLNDSTSGDIEVIFEYNGDMGVGVTYIADIQYIRIFDLDSSKAIGFDSTQVTFDPFQSYEGYL